jgi:hypothetical protein
MPTLDCGHDGEGRPCVCEHLLAGHDPPAYLCRFTGRDQEADLVCEKCEAPAVALRTACADCLRRIARQSRPSGYRNAPEVRSRATSFRFRTRAVRASLPGRVVDVRPQEGDDRQAWVALTDGGRLFRLNLDEGDCEGLAQTSPRFDALHLSPDGRFAAAVEKLGQRGVVVDLATGRVTMELDRGSYFEEHCVFPAAFAVVDDRLVFVHGTAWNRLDVSDPRTGELLTARPEPPHERDQPLGEHYLDYFHCGLHVSPGGEHVAEDGWVWSPVGVTTSWSLGRWLRENVWESEDGPSKRELCVCDVWDRPLCWLDARRLAVWGLGEDESEGIIAAVRIFDVTTGGEERWFAGPKGEMVFDRLLFCSHAEEGTTVWDVATGERLLRDAAVRTIRYHRGAKSFLTVLPDGEFAIRNLVGWPTDPAWRSLNVRRVAEGIARERTFGDLPVLADALEEAGCDDAEVLAHCRAPGPHGAGCWVVDRVLDEER